MMIHTNQLVDLFFSIGLFFNATLFIPQAIKIFKHKNANELSLITFSGFNLMQIATTLHGFFHGDYILMIGTFASFITCGLVTILILIYN